MKKWILCLIFIIFILSISATCASDNTSTDTLNVNDATKITGVQNVDGNSFKDIQDAIDTAGLNDTIYLNGKTYIGNGTQISISKSITIDGSGENTISNSILDANNLSGIFNANGNYNIILKNLIIKKANYDGSGAVIYQNSGKLSLINCTFTDFNYKTTTTFKGGAIYMGTGSNLNINNLSYFNNNILIQTNVEGLIAYLGNNSICNIETLNIYSNNIRQMNPSEYSSMGFSINSKSRINISKVNYTNNNFTFKGHLYGSLIDTTSNSNVTLSDLYFNKNSFKSSYFYGGIIYSEGNMNIGCNNIIMTNNIINSTVFNGGLVFDDSPKTKINIDVINFINNTIISTEYSIAGSIISLYGTNNNVVVNNSLIKNNYLVCTGTGQYSYITGGCFYLHGTLKIYNTKFINQTLSSYQQLTGGSITLSDGSNFYGDNISEENSTSYSKYGITGSSIYVAKGSNSVLSNSYFSNNYEFGNIRDKSKETHGTVDLIGNGKVSNCNFTNNRASQGLGIALRIGPQNINNPFIVEYCNFINNSADSAKNDSGRTHYMDHGGAMCVSGAVGGSAIIRKCLFENNTNSQGGAMTPHNHCLIEDCRFINNIATKYYGGAISTEDLINPIDNVDVTIRNCYFENNGAPIGGAIQAKGDKVLIDNCTFTDNVAVQGGAVFLEGKDLKVFNSTFSENNATHKLDYKGIVTGTTHLPQVNEWISLGGAVYIHGNYALLDNNTFNYNSAIHISDKINEGKGGAIYIYGEFSKTLNSYFNANFAHSGNGSALYVFGANTIIDHCEFYNHDSERGTAFIIGTKAGILNSIFKNNTASRGGAGIYIEGDYTLVNKTEFENNNATIHGGAIHSHGDYARILNSIFISNNAHPHDEDMDYGLGGAIYTRGDFNDIAYCEFEFNTARNGSAIYNRGANLTVEDCDFHYNQAYSYNLLISVKPVVSNYTKNNTIEINITYIGGDNIINAIYNDGSNKNIFFYNVTYEHSSIEGKRNTGYSKINPVASAELSQNGELVYQDSREDLQFIELIITRENYTGLLSAPQISGDIVKELSGRTGLYGNISFYLEGDLKPGTYNIYASHPDDKLYKGIDNHTRFEISPQVDLIITKSSDRDTYFVSDTATYTITIKSLGTDAHDVNVSEIMPNEFEILNYTASKGEFKNNIWFIPLITEGSTETLIITVKLTTNGTFTNIVNVTSQEDDINPQDNVANATITVKNYVDLDISKSSNVKLVKVGEEIVWTITIKNRGVINATGVTLIDKIPDGLEYISHVSSKGNYSAESGVWAIGELAVNETLTLNITTKALKPGQFINTANATSNENDTNSTNNNARATVEVIEDKNQTNPKQKDDKKPTKPKEKDDKKPKKDDNKNHKNSNDLSKSSKKSSAETGNPLIALILALIIIPIRRFKK